MLYIRFDIIYRDLASNAINYLTADVFSTVKDLYIICEFSEMRCTHHEVKYCSKLNIQLLHHIVSKMD